MPSAQSSSQNENLVITSDTFQVVCYFAWNLEFALNIFKMYETLKWKTCLKYTWRSVTFSFKTVWIKAKTNFRKKNPDFVIHNGKYEYYSSSSCSGNRKIHLLSSTTFCISHKCLQEKMLFDVTSISANSVGLKSLCKGHEKFYLPWKLTDFFCSNGNILIIF